MIPITLRSTEELEKLYPPRAEAMAPPSTLGRFKGFIAQYKYNDIRTLFHVGPQGIELYTRKREPVREYQLTAEMQQAWNSLHLSRDQHHTIDGGILRHLVLRGQSPIIVWDILVHDGIYLLGTTYRERYQLLKRICGGSFRAESLTGREVGLVVTGLLWLAPWYENGFENLYEKTLDVDYLEGLILKDPRAKLASGFHERNNTRWQIKFRKQSKSYMF